MVWLVPFESLSSTVNTLLEIPDNSTLSSSISIVGTVLKCLQGVLSLFTHSFPDKRWAIFSMSNTTVPSAMPAPTTMNAACTSMSLISLASATSDPWQNSSRGQCFCLTVCNIPPSWRDRILQNENQKIFDRQSQNVHLYKFKNQQISCITTISSMQFLYNVRKLAILLRLNILRKLFIISAQFKFFINKCFLSVFV